MKRLVLCLFLGLFLLSVVSAGSAMFVNSQYTQPNFRTYYGGNVGTYWPILNEREQCLARQDLLLGIAPAGCQPAVVRSDLLAEQNVPVFCQVSALQVNPLVTIKELESIRFTGSYPAEVSGVGFHPARAALRTRDQLLGDPLVNNVGYVVIVLKKQPKESLLPGKVELNLQANLKYDAGNALGVGRSEFLLTEQSDQEWEQARKEGKQSFFNGKYQVRLEEFDARQGSGSSASRGATLGIYSGTRKIGQTRVEPGKSSAPLFLPGSFCQAGVTAEILGYELARDRATLRITGTYGTETVDVYQGSSFLQGQCRLTRLIVDNRTGLTGSVDITCTGAKAFTLKLLAQAGTMTSEGGMNVLRERTYAPDIEANISATIAAYRLVAEQYPAERGADVEGIEPYGEQALYRAVQVAGTYGKQMTQAALLGELLLHYPDSLRKEQYQAELDRLHAVDGSESTGVLSLQNQYRTITLVGVSKPLSKAHALLKINNEDVRLEEGKNWTRENSFIKLTRIKPEEVTLITNCAYSYRRASGSVDEPQAARTGGSYTLHLNEFDDATICGKGVRISNIESENVVRVRLSTTAERTESQTNLTVRIGIEKRAIQLSPAKAAERVSNLNKSIQRWEQLNKNLEKIVTGMKGACFATAGVLMVKNFFNGLVGKGFARKEAMNGANGWTDFCRTQVSNGKFATLDSCYTANNAAIEQDVAKRDEAVKQVNKEITEIQKHPNITRSDGLLSDSVDTEQAAAQYRTYLNQTYSSDLIAQGIDVKHASYTELREAHMNLLLQKQGGGSDLLGKDIEAKLKGIGKSTADQRTLSLQLKADAEATAKGDIQGIVVAPNSQLPRQGAIMSKQAAESTKNSYYGGTYAHYTKVTTTASVDQNGNPLFAPATYGLGLEKQADGSYVTKDVFDSTGRLLTEQERAQFINTYNVGSFRDSASSNWEKNKWEKPVIQYYESEPHKGLPALVPVDPDHGWYAATKPTLPAFGGLAGWESSGRVASFYLCNVGENKRPDVFTGYSDDSCTLINLGAGQAADKVPGVPEGRAAQLVKQAREALEDAARAHKQGGKQAIIRGKGYAIDKPAVPLPGVQCQDYMSPSECNLLFNVCDPVICPASRCDFGGKYPVQDVVQSGIIGSTLLCLPNFPDVKIPVCLTGIHAGIDAYTSILKAHRDCLQESITSGRMVGICDQIYSIYSCEFFWRQLSPLANIFVPKVIEQVQGQGARGGGEYLTTQSAWQNTKQSADYFTGVYGVNAFKAFQVRSTEEVGGEICKGFASGQFPGSFKSLVKPDSPVQFHASFSSIRYTDATVPATAQYKVFYHIYAGKDQGAGYRIYLRNPPATSYYASQPTIQVASGFVGKGQYADETKDFTAPEGYQELCVSINGDERCGFKQVSTSFAVNQLRDQVVADELKNTRIKSEQECISGTVSASALLNPNLQQMGDEAADPGIYRRGIIRVCATGNPGQTTDPTRFVEVGVCGDEKLKCWLDKQSVQNAITDVNKGVKNATYEWFANRTVANLEKDGTILGAESGYAELTRLEGVVNGLETYQGQKSRLSSDHLSRIGLLAREFMQTKDALFFNHHRARLGWLEGRVQEVLLKHLVADRADSLQQAGQLDRGILVREMNGIWQIKILASGIWISVADFKEDPNYFDQLSSFQQSTLNYLLEQTAETSESDTLGKHHYLLDQPGVTVTSNKNTEQAYYYVPRGDEETTSATPPAGKSPALPKTPPSSSASEIMPSTGALAHGALDTTLAQLCFIHLPIVEGGVGGGVGVAEAVSNIDKLTTVTVEAGTPVSRAGALSGRIITVNGKSFVQAILSNKIIGKVDTSGRITKLSKSLATQVSKTHTVASTAIGRGVISSLSLEAGAKLVDASGNVVGELGKTGQLVQKSGILKLVTKANPWFKILGKIGTGFTFHDLLCTGYKVQKEYFAYSAAALDADLSAREVDQAYGNLINRLSQRYMPLETALQELEATRDAYLADGDVLPEAVRDIALLRTSLDALHMELVAYMRLFRVYSSESTASAPRESAFQLGEFVVSTFTPSSLTEAERKDLETRYTHLNSLLRAFNATLVNLQVSLQSALEGTFVPSVSDSLPSVQTLRSPDFVVNINEKKSFFTHVQGNRKTLFYLLAAPRSSCPDHVELHLSIPFAFFSASTWDADPLVGCSKHIVNTDEGAWYQLETDSALFTRALTRLQNSKELALKDFKLLTNAYINEGNVYASIDLPVPSSSVSQQSSTRQQTTSSVKDDTSPTAGSGTPLKD